MENILIFIVTALFFLLFVVSMDNRKMNPSHLFSSIGEAYQCVKCVDQPFGSLLVKIGFVLAVLVTAALSFIRSQDLLGSRVTLKLIGLTICVFILLLSAMYFLLGIPLLIFTRIENLIQTIHQHKLSYRFLISSYISFMYAVLYIMIPEDMIQNGVMVFIGLGISYTLNMIMLVNISMEPLRCFHCELYKQGKVEQKYPLKVVLSGAIILVVLIVVNLFLAVNLINQLFPGAYINMYNGGSVSGFDLFYYTVISFTTIGYGEIVPQCLESRLMAVVIAYTSVMCLVIFISSVMSLKDKLTS